MIARVASLLRRLTQASSVPPTEARQSLPPSLADQLRAGGLSTADWLTEHRRLSRLYAALPDEQIAMLRRRFPDQAARTVSAADRILRHEFNLLGSGLFVPVDPARPPRDGYTPIDWYLDPIRKLRFPERVPYRDWNLLAMRPGLADVKLPWELARSQHWPTLGQAYRLTADDRYASEIVNQHDDFVAANPVGFGVNWTCTMDVAIRAFNWALALELVQESSAVTGAALERTYTSLFEHATFIEANLENKYEVTSNHFLSNVVGLYALGLVFHDLPAGGGWVRRCREWLEQEMRVQVLADGADYESSIPYHRLVTELFLSGARLAEIEGVPLSAAYLHRLQQMVEFLLATTRPDGLQPQVGDADDGRLHIFTGYGTWNPQDARHLTAPAAIIMRRPEWLRGCDADGLWEAAWWGCDVDDVSVDVPPEAGAEAGTWAIRPTPPRPNTPGRTAPVQAAPGQTLPIQAGRLFADAGIAVARTAGAYLLATNGRVGTNGFGNHKHNDLLGFEFHSGGIPLIVDPGSYVYTSDPDARNTFRGTAYHNTIRVDGAEQNDLKPEYLFRLFETSTVEHLGFVETDAHVEYSGRHSGYARLPHPVIHERTLRLLKGADSLEIIDVLRGTGAHELAWHFHFAPGVDVESGPSGGRSGGDAGQSHFILTARGSARGPRFRFTVPRELAAVVQSAWYSPSYGVRVQCEALELRCETVLAGERRWSFALEPA